MAYFGSDSGWDGGPQNPHASGTQFYIGRLGYGLSVDTDYFNRTLAQNLLETPGNKVYGYWYVLGPEAEEAANYATPYDFGVAQGTAANLTRADYLRYGLINGQTVFADIEHDPSWGSDSNANRQVINGFLSKLSYPGVYSAPCAWQDITGSLTWKPSKTPVIWTSQYNWGSVDPGAVTWKVDSNPYCGSTTQAAQGFAGLTPTIWQYAINVVINGYNVDFDIASSLPT